MNKDIKPIMQWAGGKTQMLKDILPMIPEYKGKYIEPFFGGGALFFALQPENSVISDSNPELINMYMQVRDNVDHVIKILKSYNKTKQLFYEVRALEWESLPKSESAARTIYLNKASFNGLYRVNKKGQFNASFGGESRIKNKTICDENRLRLVSELLKRNKVICGDYMNVLKEYAKPGDFIFLDPPYVPVSKYADFTRYTKEKFYMDDHINLAKEVQRLHELGCYIMLTNSDHPIVHELYKDFDIRIVNTRRSISSKAETRSNGKDVIVKNYCYK